MITVLCVEKPGLLGQTRRLLLERAGHNVVTVSGLREAEEACRREHVEVAVVAQGIAQKKLLVQRLRHCLPAVRILELHSATSDRAIADADDWLQVPALSPAELVQRVEALAQRDGRSQDPVKGQEFVGAKGHSRRVQERTK